MVGGSLLVLRLCTSDKVYRLLPHRQWFSPGIPASSTTKTGRHDIAEIKLKVSLITRNQIKSNQFMELRLLPPLKLVAMIYSVFFHH